jgi:hypothetical protein
VPATDNHRLMHFKYVDEIACRSTIAAHVDNSVEVTNLLAVPLALDRA